MDSSALKKNSRIGLLLLLLLMVAAAIYLFRQVILPFAVAAFLAYLLAPIINRSSRLTVWRYQVPRGLAILIVYALCIGLLVLMGFYLAPKLTTEVNGLVRDMPKILKKIERTWIIPFEEGVNDWLAEFVQQEESEVETAVEPAPIEPEKGTGEPAPKQEQNRNGGWEKLVEDYTFVVKQVDDGIFEVIPKKRGPRGTPDVTRNFEVSKQISAAFHQFRSSLERNILELLKVSRHYLVVVVSSFFSTFLVLMVSAFMLADPQRTHNFVSTLLSKKYRHRYDDLIKRLDYGLSGVVRGQVIICVVNGTLTGIGIAILGVPFVFTLSLIATIFSLIPIFGVLISTIPILLMALTVSFSTAVMAMGWILVVHFIEGNFLNPKILGDSAKIHPVLIVFALVAGQYLGGIMGALLAVPVFSLIQNSFLFLKGLAEELEPAQ